MCNSFVCEHITKNELINTIADLSDSKAPSANNFSNFLIKRCCTELIEPLLFLYNLSFNKGIFPNKLKTCKVIPLYKSDNHSIMSNYTLVAKIVETFYFFWFSCGYL